MCSHPPPYTQKTPQNTLTPNIRIHTQNTMYQTPNSSIQIQQPHQGPRRCVCGSSRSVRESGQGEVTQGEVRRVCSCAIWTSAAPLPVYLCGGTRHYSSAALHQPRSANKAKYSPSLWSRRCLCVRPRVLPYMLRGKKRQFTSSPSEKHERA